MSLVESLSMKHRHIEVAAPVSEIASLDLKSINQDEFIILI